MESRSKLDRFDALMVIALLLLVWVFALDHLNFSTPPGEDAAILMRYSQHLAQGHGIVWNIGEKPVDGATDFLFMVVLAGLAKVGCSLEGAARLVGMVSHALTLVLVYLGIRARSGSDRLAASLSAAYLAVGPAIGYIASGFGAPFFALLAGLTWYLAIKIRQEGDSGTNSWLFAVSGLVMGLIRPEGVFLAILMLVAILYAKGWKGSRTTVICFLMVFSILGGLYFVWRWHYFGYPLPNPFYKKGGGRLYGSSLKESIANALVLGGPFLGVYVLGFCSPKTVKQTAFAMVPIAGFVSLWILLSNAMNYLMRFQYAILPIVLLSWPTLFEAIREDRKLPRFMDLDMQSRTLRPGLIGVVIVCGLVYWGESWGEVNMGVDFNYQVAVMLDAYSHKHYTLATSEAGLLPLYSNWRTIDVWGLNNPWVAHNGKIAESYLEQQRPEVITFHASFSPIVRASQDPKWPLPGEWYSMVMTVKDYAERNQYTLVGAFGPDPHNAYYYYVRQDFPDGAAIMKKIREMEKTWKGWGIINFARFKSEDGL